MLDDCSFILDNHVKERAEDIVDQSVGSIAEAHRSELSSNNRLNGWRDTEIRNKFSALSEIMSNDNKAKFDQMVKDTADKIINSALRDNDKMSKGELDSLKNKVQESIRDAFDSKLAEYKHAIEAYGEQAMSNAVFERVAELNKEITGYKNDNSIVKALDDTGRIFYGRVDPVIGDMYNNRPVYAPKTTLGEVMSTLALIKRIQTTGMAPKSWAKQAITDSLVAYVSTGAFPFTMDMMKDDIVSMYGTKVAAQIQMNDPYRYSQIKMIAENHFGEITDETISKAIAIENSARAESQLPFTTMTSEINERAANMRYGDTTAEARQKAANGTIKKINKALARGSEKLSKLSDKREMYSRKVAGMKAYRDALDKGYSYEQAEWFQQFAINNATTNFRQSSTMFNTLRSSTPYLVSGISGTKSFWKMFEMDPLGVTSRLYFGIICPLLFFMGEIMVNADSREEYGTLTEYQKDGFLLIRTSAGILRIPVGEELGTYANFARHIAETLYGENKASFLELMAHDSIGLLPVDLTGFIDPDAYSDLTGEDVTLLGRLENGIATLLAQTAPPIAQSGFMITTGRDLYTGKKVNTDYTTIDPDTGESVVMTSSQSEFASTLAKMGLGDSKLIEKVTTMMFGTTTLKVLDAMTAAGQYVTSGGEGGSLTDLLQSEYSEVAKNFAVDGADSLDREWSAAMSELWAEKEDILSENTDTGKLYAEYNKKIKYEDDADERRKLRNQRNNLLSAYQTKVANVIAKYRANGGSLTAQQYATLVSLLSFEDATEADMAARGVASLYDSSYAKTQAMQTLESMGCSKPDGGVSALGYIYTDDDGNEQIKMWTPEQLKVVTTGLYNQGDFHVAAMTAILDDGSDDSIKNLYSAYNDKISALYNQSSVDYDAIDDLAYEYDEKLFAALDDYISTYGADVILNNTDAMNYLVSMVIVPTEYEKVNGRYVSSGGGVLNKKQGFARSYLRKIYGVKTHYDD